VGALGVHPIGRSNRQKHQHDRRAPQCHRLPDGSAQPTPLPNPRPEACGLLRRDGVESRRPQPPSPCIATLAASSLSHRPCCSAPPPPPSSHRSRGRNGRRPRRPPPPPHAARTARPPPRTPSRGSSRASRSATSAPPRTAGG